MPLEMKYFILKPKSKKKNDPFAKASRLAMMEFARQIKEHDSKLASELEKWAREEEANAVILEKPSRCTCGYC